MTARAATASVDVLACERLSSRFGLHPLHDPTLERERPEAVAVLWRSLAPTR